MSNLFDRLIAKTSQSSKQVDRASMESHPGRYTIPKFDHAELVNYLGLVGPAEIAEKAGVSRTMVNKWRERFDDFPEPLVTLKMGPLWAWADVEPWIKAQRAKGPGRPQKAR